MYKYFLYIWVSSCFFLTSYSYAQNTQVQTAGSYSVGVGTNCSVSLGDIIIAETDTTDFQDGTDVSYFVDLPEGFEYAMELDSVKIIYEALSGMSSYIPSANPKGFTKIGGVDRRLRFFYTINNTGKDRGRFIIRGLEVNAVVSGKEGNVLKGGGTGIQEGNPANAQIHATLSSQIKAYMRISEYNYEINVNSDLHTFLGSDYSSYQNDPVPLVGGDSKNVCRYSATMYLDINAMKPSVGNISYRYYDGNTNTFSGAVSANRRSFSRTLTVNGNRFFYGEMTQDGCIFRSDTITLNQRPIPTTRAGWISNADTTFYPYEDPALLPGRYVSYSGVSTQDTVAGFFMYPQRGINRMSTENYLFVPSLAGLGSHYVYYLARNKTSGCTNTYSFEKNLYVNDPSNPLPTFVRANTPPPYCITGEKFKIWGECPDSLYITSFSVSSGIGPVSGTYYYNYGPSSTRTKTDEVEITPSNYLYNGGLVYVYMSVRHRENNDYMPPLTGYVVLFPKRNPKIFGLPEVKYTTTNKENIIELCATSKDTIIMRPNPDAGLYRFYIDTTNTFQRYNDDFGRLIPGEVSTRIFTPEELFINVAKKKYNAKIKIVYVYPGVAGACPDSVIYILSYGQPVGIKAHRLSPISDTICYGDTVHYNIQNFRPGMNDKFSWSFGDGITFESDTNDYRSYVYNRPGRFFIRFQTILSTLDSGYCNNDELDTIWVGAKPKTSFLVANPYAEDSMLLFSTSQVLVNNTFAPVDSINRWEWNTGTGVHYTDTVSGMRKHLYTTAAQQPYSVRLITTSGWGCTDTLIRRIPIFPKIMVGKLHQETFNSSQVSGWYESGMYGLPLHKSSWSNTSVAATRRIQPQVSGNDFWITNKARTPVAFPVGYYNLEHSWVESPAFDLSTCDYPMIGMDTWCHSDNLFDGASLQYTLVNDTTWFGEEIWTTIGVAGQGQGWYDYNTVLSQPGGNYNAWSGEKDRTWKRSSYEIDFIKDSLKQLADLGQEHWVRFRVVFASNADNTPGKAFDGFAFDNFFLANRNRRVLAEQFVNVQRQDTTIQSIVNDPQAAVISYYVGHAAPDPINRINKADPSARSLLYGIDQIPRVVLDGVSTSNTTSFETWGTSAFNERKLTPSAFQVAVQAQRLPDGQLKVDVTAMKDTNLQVAGPFLLKVVVVEDSIQLQGSSRSYYNIMRKMLPDAVGTRYEDWNEGESNTVSYSWNHFAAPMSGYTLVDFIKY
jgi:hypothetical protein